MKPVGGYFELELGMGSHSYHQVPATFKSGRSSLHYILTVCRPSLVYVPYYTCKALLQSFEAAGVPFVFYAIDEALEPVALPQLKGDQYFLYINYFDVKRALVNRLSALYGQQLIVDCTHAYFAKGNGISWFFNSCRKFFGVPDGSFVYAPNGVTVSEATTSNEAYTLEHLVNRFNGHAREGYAVFLQNEQLCGAEISGMSTITRHLLSHINYAAVIEKRRQHFDYLHMIFKNQNQFAAIDIQEGVPMMYPLLLSKSINRPALYNQDIFIPTFWEEVLTGAEAGFDIEKKITQQLLPLPIDHRYSIEDMERVANAIQSIV